MHVRLILSSSLISLPAEILQHLQGHEGRGPPHREGVQGAGPPLGGHRRQVRPLRRPGARQQSSADPDGVQDVGADVAETVPVVRNALNTEMFMKAAISS